MNESERPSGGGRPPCKEIAKDQTGIRGLDEILNGGLPRGRTTLISGGPGTGKTVLAYEFLHRGAENGEPGLFVTFEELADNLRANAASMGMDPAPLEKAGKLDIVQASPPRCAVRAGEFDLHGLLAIVEGRLGAMGANRVVLDAIDVLLRLFGDPDREEEELYALHDWLRDRALTALITIKAPERTPMYPFLDFMTDCVLFLDQRVSEQVRTRRLRVVKYRGSGFQANEHPFVLSSDGAVFMPMGSLALGRKGSEGTHSSGNARLDEILGGGFRRGAAILVSGPSGAGKTTLACTFARKTCDAGERVLYVDFELSRGVLVEDMLSTGVDLRPALESGLLSVHSAMPEAMGIEEHLLGILHTLETLEPRLLILDAVSACERMGEPRSGFDFLIRLLSICRERGVTCLYTRQAAPNETTLDIGGSEVSSVVDVLVGMTYVDDGRRLRRQLVVVKTRGRSHSMAYHDFAITSGGLILDRQDEDETARGTGEGGP